jgi:hypothetical protein
MTLKKKLLVSFYKALRQTKPLKLADARLRDQVLTKGLFDALHDFEEARKKIYLEFCVKNDKGEPIVMGNEYQFPPDKKDYDKAQEEIKILEEEEVEVPVANQPKIKEFLEATIYIPEIGESELIDEVIAKLQ